MKRSLLVLCLLAAHSAFAGRLTLSPAVVPLGGRAGQSTHQHIDLVNDTDEDLVFDVAVQDVIVRDGRRVFVPAGDVRGSIAATAALSAPSLSIAAGEQRGVDVTLTLPHDATGRAVVVLFKTKTPIARRASVSIGSLLTFDLAGRVSLDVGQLVAEPATLSSNTTVSMPVKNDGDEPLVISGAAALVGPRGTIVGRLAIESRRLLPGEQAVLRAVYPGDLRPGTYRVIATAAAGSRSWTRSGELVVP